MREMAPRKNSFLKVTPNEIVLRNEKNDNVGLLESLSEIIADRHMTVPPISIDLTSKRKVLLTVTKGSNSSLDSMVLKESPFFQRGSKVMNETEGHKLEAV